MPIELSDERAPLMVVTAIGVLTDEQYRRHLVHCTKRLIARNRPYAYVYDATRGERMTATHRKMQADWLTQNSRAIARLNLGCAFAFSSPMARGMLRAVHWLSPLVYEYSVHSTRQAAIEWGLKRLARAGIEAA